jgi:AcrR family transcriptional regulator
VETATATRPREILDAALACFDEHGYDATTIDQIRRHSGASIGSIYHHFGGKDRIAAAIYAEALRDYQEGFLDLLGAGSVERTIKELVRHHLRWVEANPAEARFLHGMRGVAGSEVRGLNREAFARVEAWRREHTAALQPLSFDAFYAVVIGPAQEASRHWLAGRTKTPLRRLERELGDAAWRAIKGDTQ